MGKLLKKKKRMKRQISGHHQKALGLFPCYYMDSARIAYIDWFTGV